MPLTKRQQEALRNALEALEAEHRRVAKMTGASGEERALRFALDVLVELGWVLGEKEED
jgi:hypothetical protein